MSLLLDWAGTDTLVSSGFVYGIIGLNVKESHLRESFNSNNDISRLQFGSLNAGGEEELPPLSPCFSCAL